MTKINYIPIFVNKDRILAKHIKDGMYHTDLVDVLENRIHLTDILSSGEWEPFESGPILIGSYLNLDVYFNKYGGSPPIFTSKHVIVETFDFDKAVKILDDIIGSHDIDNTVERTYTVAGTRYAIQTGINDGKPYIWYFVNELQVKKISMDSVKNSITIEYIDPIQIQQFNHKS